MKMPFTFSKNVHDCTNERPDYVWSPPTLLEVTNFNSKNAVFQLAFFSLFGFWKKYFFFQFWDFFDTFLRRNIQMCRFHPSSRGFLAEAKSETCDANAELTVSKSLFLT